MIAGEFRSRKLKSPPGLDTRPTPDRLRESLFSILAPIIGDAVFADVYAGCGSVGIEALSRGARQAIFFERSRVNCGVIRENLDSLAGTGISGRARVIHGPAATYLAANPADIYFMDPPYGRDTEYDTAMRIVAGSAAPSAIVIAQHASRHSLAAEYGALRRYRVVRQGDNSLSFYRFENPTDDHA